MAASTKNMARVTSETPVTCRISDYSTIFSGEPHMIFGFLEESQDFSGSSSISDHSYHDDGDDDENSGNAEEKKAFWESQEQLLKATLCRKSSIESKIRKTTKQILKELNVATIGCVCRKPEAEGCRNCTQREISDRLRQAGYNSAVCKAKWKRSKEVPSGEHTYLEVLDTSSSNKGEMRVIVELNFRAEFEMVRGSEEYDKLINQLPEVFIGKIERLQALIKILCLASKRCMKEQKMHIAPWRKLKYMQAKWLGTPEMRTPTTILPVVERSQSLPRQKVSLLTFDLVENLSGLFCMAIKVV